jgi:ferredoxin
VVRDGAIVYDEIVSPDELPAGWTDEQDRGTYRLKRRGDKALFGYTLGPYSWKKFLHPPMVRLWRAKRNGRGFQLERGDSEVPKFAFIGVRSCELHAIRIQDKVFIEGEYVDPIYKSRRENVFIIAVNCSQAGNTCFCASMGTGPRVTFGFDIVLTEIIEGDRHYFIAEAGSDNGVRILKNISRKEAGEREIKIADEVIRRTEEQMGRDMDVDDIKELLYRNCENPYWEEVGSRCLTCGNCTMVCPTCFCTTVEDVTDLKGEYTERWRRWDSCFTMDFSYIHGGSIRASSMARYRHWITHKLASWIDQFDIIGCVGCGRCITWCPVGIDITEEVRKVREIEKIKKETHHGNT